MTAKGRRSSSLAASDARKRKKKAPPVQDRRVLVLAYYFPPMGLSGVQRTVKFVKYLPEFGWNPTVLTCDPGGYFAYDDSLLQEIKEAGVEVVRARSLDPTRLFRKKQTVRLPEEGRRRTLSYLSQIFFIPDNKVGWWGPARKEALRLHAGKPFDLIFSTAPPYTAHLIASSLSRKTGLPLVLDFRDDWMGNPRHVYPTPIHRALSTALERRAVRCSRRAIVINEYIRRNLASRNADILPEEDVVVVPQGFDPADFAAQKAATFPVDADKFRLIYSGVFYDAQSPAPFIRGLADLITRRADLRARIEVVFVGLLPKSTQELARQLGLADVIRYVGYVPHEEAVANLQAADALWMTVGRSEGSETISTSKLFEYFGTRKPILGLVPDGAAREALKQYRAAEIADPDVVPEISTGIERLYNAWAEDRLSVPPEDFVQQFDRKRLTDRLARLFNSVLRDAKSGASRGSANGTQP